MEKALNDRVRFNVGGRIFETTSTTLANAGRGSFFGAMLDDNWNLRQPQVSPIPEYFIDRNPDCFNILLDLLRTKILYIPPHIPEKLLYKEAQFYGLTNLVRSSKWGPIDPNRLKLSHSISGHDSGEGVAIRASPDGGCCTVHGCIVHVYDWTMNQHSSPFNLDYQLINDVCYVDSERIIVSAWEKTSGEVRGGLGLFNSFTSELTHRFSISHNNQDNKSYTAGALSYNLNNHKIFASCRGRSNEYGVGVWDQLTGQQLDFFYEPFGWSLGDADRLQWLQSYNCLLVSTMYPKKDHCYISLLDFRCKRMVWSWSDMESVGKDDDKRVRDVVAMEDNGTICVVNDYEDLGFMDLRGSVGTSNGVRWRSQSRLMSRLVGGDETCFPKLAIHQGRIFRSMNDSVLVHSGPEWIVTSRLKSSCRGSIYDFAIGGDRLFALHNDENVFDVWETTPPLC